MYKHYSLLALLFILFACSDTNRQQSFNEGHSPDSSLAIHYARGFQLSYYGPNKLITIYNPWQGAKAIEYHYWLPVDTTAQPPVAHAITVPTPIKSLVCLSTTHTAMMEFMGLGDKIVGISGRQYINSPYLQKRISEGKVKDVGFPAQLNYEQLVNLKPDAVMTYEVAGNTGYMAKLSELGIPSFINGEYLENDPLGRAEWVVFVAAFFNKEHQAARRFQSLARQYERLKKQVPAHNHGPTVLTGLPYKSVWYVPGGESYFAHLIADAGGRYLWQDTKQRESLALNFEQVLNQAVEADIWLHTGSANELQQITATDTRMSHFKAFQQGRVYNNNKRRTVAGGSDFWESGTMAPHVLLKDLIHVLHPGQYPDYEPVYYHKLQ